MSNISHAPIHTRFFAGLIDIIFLTAGGFLLYFLLHQLVVHQGFPPKAVTFFLNLYVLLTPLYFFYWKKVSGTPGNYFTGTAIITEGLRSTITGDLALLRSLLVFPAVPLLLSLWFFPNQSWSFRILGGWLLLDNLWVFVDANRRCLHDRLLGAQVISKKRTAGVVYESKKETLSFSYIVLTIFSLFSVYPILRVFSISIRPGDRLLSKSLAIIPDHATLSTYVQLFTEQPFLRWMLNSFIVTAAVTVVGVCLAATAGYAFSRFKFRGRDTAMLGLITTQMFPATMLLLPLFIMLIKIGAYDSYIGLIIAYSATALPFTIWQMKGYYDTIPYSLEEAASIDGCSQGRIFWQIILPLASPALAITALFSFMTAWSEYLVAAVLIQDKNLFTLPLGLKLFQSAMQTSWGLYSAGAILVSVPVVIIFMLLSKYLISGLTLGSVKG